MKCGLCQKPVEDGDWLMPVLKASGGRHVNVATHYDCFLNDIASRVASLVAEDIEPNDLIARVIARVAR